MSMYALQVMTGMEAEIAARAWTPDARRSGG